MSTLWRLQTNTDSISKKKIAQYCLDNKCIAMGWSIKDEHINNQFTYNQINEVCILREKIEKFSDYENIIQDYKIYNGKVNDNVKRLYQVVKTDDLIWMRFEGLFYLGRITEKSHWMYRCDIIALNHDASNQVTNVDWYEIGDESYVPGAISTSFIRGKALQSIKKKGMIEYSQQIFNEKSGKGIYPKIKLKKEEDTFYSLLSTDDCEDLLCLWLYAEYGYITIPSTNKKSTEKYECVLIDPSTGQHIYPQVKSGEVNINAQDYVELSKRGDVWLFTTKGKVVRISSDPKNIYDADPQELFKFVGEQKAKNILPQGIIKWYKMLTEG